MLQILYQKQNLIKVLGGTEQATTKAKCEKVAFYRSLSI